MPKNRKANTSICKWINLSQTLDTENITFLQLLPNARWIFSCSTFSINDYWNNRFFFKKTTQLALQMDQFYPNAQLTGNNIFSQMLPNAWWIFLAALLWSVIIEITDFSKQPICNSCTKTEIFFYNSRTLIDIDICTHISTYIYSVLPDP